MEGYEYCYCECAKEYLRQRLGTCATDDKYLAELTGYKDLDKFKRHQDAWHGLERPIPRKYLDAIGANLDILRSALERDQVNFELMDALPRTPAHYTVRLLAAVYQMRFFDDAIPEAEAIRRIKAYSAETGFRCCINYPQLLTIYIEPDGSVSKTYYRPAMKVTDNWVAFERDGSRVGTMRIG